MNLPTVTEITTTDSRYANLTERFEFVGHSWFQMSNAIMLAALYSALQPKRVLEVGSWMGASARFHAQWPSVESVVCVDHWDRTRVENWAPGLHPEDWMDNMYERFMANALHTGLGDKIRPLRMPSQEAAEHLRDERFDVVYIDGAHATDAVRQDLEAYAPLAIGLFCGDDWGHTLPGEEVQRAVKEWAEGKGLLAVGVGNFWWIHGEKPTE